MHLGLPDCLPKDSWFREWVALWPTAESPLSYILFSGMAVLGACLARKVWLDMDIHQVRPMLNLLLIGPSGIGKSTSVRISKKLLNYIPEDQRPQFFEGGSTKEKLHRDLVHQPKAILFAPELAAFFSREKYKESLIPYVTQLLDYEEITELRTIKDNIIQVKQPSVTIMGGSTVDWLQGQLPDSAVSGGFLARFLIMFEEEKGRKIANPHRALTASQYKRLIEKREATFSEFSSLVASHEGQMDYEDYDAAEAYANWYNKYEPEVGYLAPFAARAGEMILRLAMILAISAKRNALRKGDIDSAIHLYSYIASKLNAVVVPTSPTGRLAANVITTIGNLDMSSGEVARAMKTQSTQTDLEKIMENLVYSGDVDASSGRLTKELLTS